MENTVKLPVEHFSQLKAQTDPAILNFSHLATYTSGNAALEGELLGLFEVQVEQLVESIMQSNDRTDWKMAVHTLKGGAGGIGAVEVEKACMALEESGFVLREIGYDRLRRAVARCLEQIRLLTKSA